VVKEIENADLIQPDPKTLLRYLHIALRARLPYILVRLRSEFPDIFGNSLVKPKALLCGSVDWIRSKPAVIRLSSG
jgi:hypothetical protein